MYDELKERCRACSQGCDSPSECSYFYKPPLRCMRQLLSEAADAIEERCQQVDKFAEEAARLYAKMPRWIPVSERLPEENAPCIVYNKDYGPMVGWRVDSERFRIPGSRFPDRPTHWMPLPQRPKEE